MPTIDLNKKGIDIDGSEFAAIAPNLQSNILKSHSRDNAKLFFLKFTAEKNKLGAWMRNFVNQDRLVITAADQKIDSANHKNGLKSKTVANFYLTAAGYKQLDLNAHGFSNVNMDDETQEDAEEEAESEFTACGNNDFVRGMKSSKVNNKLKDPELEEWEQDYNTDIHAMVLLADDDAAILQAEADTLKASLTGVAEVVAEETGKNLTGIFGGRKRNLEHFGYADGVSQPTYFNGPGVVLTSPVELQPLNIILVKDPFTDKHDNSFGSFLVYRKLEQDVEGFDKRIGELAAELSLTANQQGKMTTEDYAGALAVGRFKDGTPLIKSDIPLDEFPAFNDFKYEHTDRKAHKCPFHAHIRKTNPRGQGLLVGERYITRRGIPYGEKDAPGKKGLLFMCFQANLKRQFNFLQKTWSNSPGFPPLHGKPGIDPLIGQGNKGGQSWPKQYESHDEVDFDFAGFIKMKGGEYFFAPSITFLKNI
jgi:Dyp-type peroxidase family